MAFWYWKTDWKFADNGRMCHLWRCTTK